MSLSKYNQNSSSATIWLALANIKLPNLFSLLVLSTLLLSACGARTIVTKDDSAQYRNEKTVAPLKLPANVDASRTVAPSTLDESSVEQRTASGNALADELPISRIKVNNRAVRLQIKGDAEAAWLLLASKLGESDITVHTRNRKGERFLIGCTGVESGSKSKSKSESEADSKPRPRLRSNRRSIWSIFGRKKKQTSDYCVLQINSSRNKTTVRLLDRNALEATAASANAIFDRIVSR